MVGLKLNHVSKRGPWRLPIYWLDILWYAPNLPKHLRFPYFSGSSVMVCLSVIAICAGNSQVTGEFPSQRPVTQSFDIFFYLRPNKRLSKQWWGWWFETLSCPLWRHYNVTLTIWLHCYTHVYLCTLLLTKITEYSTYQKSRPGLAICYGLVPAIFPHYTCVFAGEFYADGNASEISLKNIDKWIAQIN